MTDITELVQILKASAKRATPGQWVAFTDAPSSTFSVHTPDDKRCGDVIKWAGFDGQRKAKANAEFIALANPANILVLVEALEKARRANAAQDNHINQQADRIESLEKKNGELGRRLYQYSMEPGEAERRIAELESFRTAYMEWSDKTAWVQTDERFDALKPWGKHRAEVLKAYIEHLESRTVKLPPKIERDDADGWFTYKGGRVGGGAAEWYNKALDDVSSSLTADGIKWEAE